ncbi:MAG: hypothetical protein ACRCX2_09615 [Paraclostridium sp.]
MRMFELIKDKFKNDDKYRGATLAKLHFFMYLLFAFVIACVVIAGLVHEWAWFWFALIVDFVIAGCIVVLPEK